MSIQTRRAAIIEHYYSPSGGVTSLEDPTSLVLTAVANTSVSVTVGTVTGADTYVVEYATQSNFSDAAEGYSGSSPSGTISGLTANTNYYLRAKAQATGLPDSGYYSSIDNYTPNYVKTFHNTYQGKCTYADANTITRPALLEQILEDALYCYLTIDLSFGIDKMWLPNTNQQGFAQIEIISGGTNNFSPQGTGPAAMSADKWDGNGTSDYIAHSWAPSAGVNFTQDLAGILCNVLENAGEASVVVGAADASNTNRTFLNPRNTANAVTVSVNSTVSSASDTNITDSTGRWHFNRINATATGMRVYRNGTNIPLTSGSAPSTGRSSAELSVLALNTNGTRSAYFTRGIGYLIIGGAGNTIVSELDAALSAYVSNNLDFFM